RATTIAQFEELLAAMDSDAEWLDRFRPPATLHFAGHMALEPGGAGERALAARVDALLAEHSIGFAFGAAASGCDVVIGERVLARGGELALVLPSQQDHFERQSVAPAGEAWVERYRALLDRATSVVAVGDGRETLHDPLATYLAGQVALGDALTKASTLSSHAHQLIVLDNDGGGPHSRALAAAWPLRERAHLLALDRESDVAALFAPDADDPARRLAFPLAIRLNMRGGDSAAIARQREPVWRALAAVSSTAVRAVPEGWDVLAESAGEAARLAQEIMSACAAGPGRMPSIGLSAGIVLAIDDRAAGHVVPIGPAVAQAGRMAQIAPGGAILASQHFAAVLAASGETALRSEYYHGGEGGPADGVYLIVPRG
ncbi:MAG: hypothetical protein KGL44_01140, partial [Sphingomonadales bacterium]|nr:hypothetical protein [Sphingomonadales bacterium]